MTRNGIAVLRYDDRGIGKSTGDFSSATTRDFTDDVLSALHFIKQHSKINKNFIGLIGHSEGGLVGVTAAAESKDIAFLIMLAGPGTTGEEILLTQTELILRASGLLENDLTKSLELAVNIYDVIKKEDNNKKASNLNNSCVKFLS